MQRNSPAGLEDHCMVARKDLADLVHSLTTERSIFVNRLWMMSRYPHRLLVITAALSEVKSPQASTGGNPNRITQSLIAVLAGLQGSVPMQRDTRTWGGTGLRLTCTRSITTNWLESNDYGRFLADNDL
jgi:hypothetical protein